MAEIDSEELEQWKREHVRARGTRPAVFMCPITLQEASSVDDLMNGHILNHGIISANRTQVIQVGDVDSHFGGTIEPQLINLANLEYYNQNDFLNRARTIEAISTMGKIHPAFIPSPKSRPKAIDVPLKDATGSVYKTVFVNAPPEDRASIQEGAISGTIEITGGAITGSLLKAAYLAMFRMVGYDIAYNWAGDYVRRTLASFAIKKMDKHTAAQHFASFKGAARIATGDGAKYLPDTVATGYVFLHVSQSDLLFAMSCLFKLNHITFIVTIPAFFSGEEFFPALVRYTDHLTCPSETTRTYFAKLKNPADRRNLVWEIELRPLRMPLASKGEFVAALKNVPK